MSSLVVGWGPFLLYCNGLLRLNEVVTVVEDVVEIDLKAGMVEEQRGQESR